MAFDSHSSGISTNLSPAAPAFSPLSAYTVAVTNVSMGNELRTQMSDALLSMTYSGVLCELL